MGAVAKRRIAGVLAAAQQRHFRALCGEHQRLNAGAGMGAVAERLLLAPPATAPGVAFAGLELDLIRAELWALCSDMIIPQRDWPDFAHPVSQFACLTQGRRGRLLSGTISFAPKMQRSK